MFTLFTEDGKQKSFQHSSSAITVARATTGKCWMVCAIRDTDTGRAEGIRVYFYENGKALGYANALAATA